MKELHPPIRVLIVDDEPLARRRLRRLLANHRDVEILGDCGDGAAAITAILQQRPDLVFLDVQMPEMGGFEVLRALPAASSPFVIFVTAYDRYALDAFEVHALDYLLKPFDRERFEKAFERARGEIRRGRVADLHQRLSHLFSVADSPKHAPPETADPKLSRILVREGRRAFFVPLPEIEWIEAAGNYLEIHHGETVSLVRQTMKRMEKKLDPKQFLRIHRSTIVNLDRVEEIRPGDRGESLVIMKDGTALILSRTYREQVRRRWGSVV